MCARWHHLINHARPFAARPSDRFEVGSLPAFRTQLGNVLLIEMGSWGHVTHRAVAKIIIGWVLETGVVAICKF